MDLVSGSDDRVCESEWLFLMGRGDFDSKIAIGNEIDDLIAEMSDHDDCF